MIGAVVLAAGQSQRMGRPKMILPWGDTTVIGRVVGVLLAAGVGEVRVVVGGARVAVETALQNFPVDTVFNPAFANGEMLVSLKVGLAALSSQANAALMVLGDQPQIEGAIVQDLVALYRQEAPSLVVPSYKMRRGHPWLLARPLWDSVMDLHPPKTLRDFLHDHRTLVKYLEVDSPTILQDVDTPDDYQRFQPGSSNSRIVPFSDL